MGPYCNSFCYFFATQLHMTSIKFIWYQNKRFPAKENPRSQYEMKMNYNMNNLSSQSFIYLNTISCDVQ